MSKVNYTEYREQLVRQMGLRIMQMQNHVHELEDMGYKVQVSCIFKMHLMAENGRGLSWHMLHLTNPTVDLDINDLLKHNDSQLPKLPLFCKKPETTAFKPYPTKTPQVQYSFNE